MGPDSASDTTGWISFDFADPLTTDLEAGRVRPLAHSLARFPGHEEDVAREYLAWTSRGSAAGAVAAARTDEPPRDRIGPYRLAEVLGRGGQGVVFRAGDVRLQRTGALKGLSLPVPRVSPGRRNRFPPQAEACSRLDHP